MEFSKTEQDVLNELNIKDNYLHEMPYMGRFRPNPYYFSQKTMRRLRCKAVDKLVDLGIAEKYDINSQGCKVRLKITSKGEQENEENKS